MKTVLFAALMLLMAPFASFSGDVPASVMTQIEESCNESVASDDQATNSEESCIAEAVEAYHQAQ